jgi:V8-like Glu-specific endopeptidase
MRAGAPAADITNGTDQWGCGPPKGAHPDMAGVSMRRTALLPVLSLAALLLISVTVQAAPGARAGHVRSVTTDRRQAAVRAYWTAARMAAARPAAMAGETQSGSSSSTGSVARDPDSYPNATAGRVFFRNPQDGINYACSGTVVNSGNRSVVLTAGHCVHTGGSAGTWVTNWAFVPGYDHGEEPFGVWTAERLATTAAWASERNFRFDIGAAVVAPNSAAQPIASVVGARGIAFDLGRGLVYDAYGYPVGSPYDGHSQVICSGPADTSDPYAPGSGPDPLGIACNMGGGASGGGWVTDGYVNSVNSYLLGDRPGTVFGPYFGAEARALYLEVADGAMTEPASPTVEQASPEPPSGATEHVLHEVTISLRLMGSLVAKGRIESTNHWCSEYVEVEIYRTRRGVTRLVKRTRSEATGLFRVRLADRPGRYRARTGAQGIDSFNSCAPGASALVPNP